MSEKAILQRLRTVDRLRELCLALMKVKKNNDQQNIEINDKTDENNALKKHENNN
jgi:hypothetical protein